MVYLDLPETEAEETRNARERRADRIGLIVAAIVAALAFGSMLGYCAGRW